ncbi:hypothetical protein SJU67_00555 [Aeromonas caviae]|uniref:hypothetical protein n=1 Tax=Aeromonas caviae TaxID=648 RepID=UPI0029DBE97E|nr:hypothetical protein [Aeromonas caviae]MDX7690296.1 hypothetical protein [Aeromonas caviae]
MPSKIFIEIKDVFYCLVISILLSVILAVTSPADLYKIVDSSLISGLVLLGAGTLIVPRLLENRMCQRKKEASLDGIQIIASRLERKLNDLVNIIGCFCIDGDKKPVPAKLHDESGSLSYWLIPGDDGYDAHERQKFNKLNAFLNHINEELGELLSILGNHDESKPAREVIMQRRAARAALVSVYLIYDIRNLLHKNGYEEVSRYAVELSKMPLVDVVSLVLSDLPFSRDEGRDMEINRIIVSDGEVIIIDPRVIYNAPAIS